MWLGPVLASFVVLGAVVAIGSFAAIRRSGARPDLARRLAGPPEMKVGELLDAENAPTRPVRVAGRIRCREPLQLPDGERLVAFHRDLEVRIGNAWRPLERLRETRSFELWDHDGSATVDPSRAAEPLITIPKVWRGSVAELEEPHASAAARLADREGHITGARATTRTLNVTDRLLILARPTVDAGRVELQPPEGGYLITNLALDDAMRLLGGRGRRAAAVGVIGIAVGISLVAIGVVGLLLAAVLG